ncbi:MAG: porin family protein [Cyclobacteriaceae bacterium]|nr:porin family protein [Cyclobacteriaceae bacterium]
MKKNLILVFALVLAAPALWAQTTQGSLTLGGGFEYYSDKSENAYGNSDYSTSSFQFLPNVGYFVVDNLEVGIRFGILSGKSGYQGSNQTKSTAFSAGPYARYYKFTSNERFAFTGAVGVSFASGKTSNGNFETKTGSVGISIAPGFAYFLTERWGLDFQLEGIGFTSYDPNKDVDNNNQKIFSFGINSLSPSLGFRYFIGK